MYAAIVTATGDPKRLAEGVSMWELSPAAGQSYRGGYLMADLKTGKFVTFNLYETEAAAREYETSGQFQKDVERFDLVDASRQVYEVLAQRAPEETSPASETF